MGGGGGGSAVKLAYLGIANALPGHEAQLQGSSAHAHQVVGPGAGGAHELLLGLVPLAAGGGRGVVPGQLGQAVAVDLCEGGRENVSQRIDR